MAHIVERGGIIMSMATLQKERDPAEDAYMATRTAPPPTTVNLNEPVSLLKYCPSILSQLSVGSCAQFTVAECDFITRNAARAKSGQSLNAELAHPGFLYEQARRKHNWFPRDSGSTVADGFDILLVDKPLLSRFPYQDNAAFDYDDNLFRNPSPIDDLQSHRPFYVAEGNALQQIKSLLDQGWAIGVSMHWTDAYYTPVNGMLPENVSWNPNIGHAMTLRGRTPDHGGLSAVINHWTDRWNPDVVKLGFDFRPGEVAIPDSFFLPGRNSPVFELRAASPEAVVIDPKPEPQPSPDPDPGSTPLITRIRYKNQRKLIVPGENFNSAATLFLDGRETEAVVDGGRFVLKAIGLTGSHTVQVRNPGGAGDQKQFNAE